MDNPKSKITKFTTTILVILGLLFSVFITLEKIQAATNVNIWLEAEYPNTRIPPMQIGNDVNASNKKYLSVPNGTGTGGEVSYTVTIPQTGNYAIWGLVMTPSANDNSFYVSVDSGNNISWNITQSVLWNWDKVGGQKKKFYLTAGTHQFKLKQQEDGTKIDKILITDNLQYSPSGLGNPASNIPETYIIEAETANTISSPMQVLSDPTASNSQYIAVPNGTGNSATGDTGVAEYNFTAGKSGDYFIWGRELAASDTDDSFFVQLDGGPKYYWAMRQGTQWKWDKVNGVNVSDPIRFSLAAGSHTLKVSWREDGAKLDKIIITSELDYLPAIEERIDQLGLVWSGVNAPFDILTHADRQFIAYYNKDRYLTVATRQTGTDQYTFKQLDDQFGGWDAHNYLTMAIDDNGDIHLAGDVHSSPLKYWRTSTPLDINSFSRISCMECSDTINESQITYPKFFRGPNNEFLFTYRQGVSGQGKNFINQYDYPTKTWRRFIPVPLLSYPENRPMSAYPEDFARDKNGIYHLVWIWRDTFDADTNHDLLYARSSDLKNWETSSGQPLTLPLLIDSTEIVDPISTGAGLLPFKVGFDATDRVIISYHKYDVNGNSQIYNTRLENGSWQIHQTTNWNCRWEFGGTGSLSPGTVDLGPVEVELDGGLSQAYTSCDGASGRWKLDPATLQPVGSYPPKDKIPPELSEIEPNVTSICGYTDIKKATVMGKGNTPESLRYFLRWITLGNNGDQPRANCSSPEPMTLRIYKLTE